MRGVRTVGARGVSTVLDASLCLLLITASALTLAGGPHTGGFHAGRPHAGGADRAATGPASADRAAAVVATSTARVTYAVDGRPRTAHDTLAGLLASAARAGALADRHGGSNASFVNAVIGRVERALRRIDHRTSAVARWSGTHGESATTRVAAGDSIPGRVVAGEAAPGRVTTGEAAPGRVVAGGYPPPDADVHAARLVVGGARITVRTWSS